MNVSDNGLFYGQPKKKMKENENVGKSLNVGILEHKRICFSIRGESSVNDLQGPSK